ncbi:hypothetical protein [Haloferula sargassicola]|uniref:C2H2-type domain-containing protein n=1 Tax=Haloferula sargassicola TaxID=490096 RepID=A0ABP9UUR1_9BACT
MIAIGLEELVGWVLGGAMVAIGLFTWISAAKHAKNERKALRHKAVCRLCLAVFEVDSRFEEHRCPHCHASTGPDGPTPLG